jgi:hypothetical protein
MESKRVRLPCMSASIHIRGSYKNIKPILLEMVRMTCYVIDGKVMCSYYKGEFTLDALSVAGFCSNGAVFNWCS